MKKRISIILCIVMTISCLAGAFSASAADAPSLTILTEAIYDGINSYSDGLALARIGNEYQYVDMNGNVAISFDKLKEITAYIGILENWEEEYSYYYDSIDELKIFGDFHDGIAAVRNYGETVYIDKNGDVVFSVDYGGIFHGGYSVASPEFDDNVEIYDSKGNLVASRNLREVIGVDTDDYYVSVEAWTTVNEGLLPVRQLEEFEYEDEDGYYEYGYGAVRGGYLNTNLEIAIPFQFDDVRPFNDGLAPAKKDGKWGFIDKTGKFVIQPQYSDFCVYESDSTYTIFIDGVAAVYKDGKWGYIDKQGNTLIPFNFDYDFEETYPMVFVNSIAFNGGSGNYKYVDKNGNAILDAPFDDANYFVNGGFALIGNGTTYKFIDKKGNNVSGKTWEFDRTTVTWKNAFLNIACYELDGKWGIMKMSGTAPETPSSWAAGEVTSAIDAGLVPEQFTSNYTTPMTRAEFCALGVKLYETVVGEEITEREEFGDTNDVNVQKLAGIGVVNGIGEGNFGPTNELTREQAATIIERLMAAVGVETEDIEPTFADNSSISTWAFAAVGKVQEYGIMNGTGDNKFTPGGTYTREQCIMTIYRLFSITGE